MWWTQLAGHGTDPQSPAVAPNRVDAQRVRGQLAERLLRCFEDADALAMPTTAITAPVVADAAASSCGWPATPFPWSFVGFPAISFTAGLVDGLPAGIQFVAPPHRDDLLIAAGLAVESWVDVLPAPALRT